MGPISRHRYTRRMPDALTELFAVGLGVDAERLSDDTSPENTSEWDSLAAISMVALIEERFDVRLSAREIMKMQTIGLARTVLTGKGVAEL